MPFDTQVQYLARGPSQITYILTPVLEDSVKSAGRLGWVHGGLLGVGAWQSPINEGKYVPGYNSRARGKCILSKVCSRLSRPLIVVTDEFFSTVYLHGPML